MSLILKKIELSNIRSHRYLNFEPAEDGITAISGTNGSGKSTIVDSIAWILYGTKPHGVSKTINLVNDNVDFTKDKIFARMIIQLDDSELKIERRIVNKQGAVECEVWERKSAVSDFKGVAGPSVSHTEPYLRKRLRMDERGFLAAVLVQQKQVDELISSGPKERAAVIENLTGISSITAALEEARQNYNSLKRTLKNSTIDESTIKSLKSEKERLEKDTTTNLKKKTDVENKVKEINDDYKNAYLELQQNEKKQREYDEANNKLERANSALESLNDELKRITKLKDEKKEQLSQVEKGLDYDEINTNLNNKRKELRNSENNITNLTAEINNLMAQSDKVNALLLKTNIKNITMAQSNADKQNNKIKELKEKKEDQEKKIIEYKGRITQINNAIQILSKENGSCPTCLQTVQDSQTAIQSLEEEKTNLKTQVTKGAEELDNINSNLAKAQELLSKFEIIIKAIEGTENNSEIINNNNGKISELSVNVTILEKEIAAIDKLYYEAKRSAETKKDYDLYLANAIEISDKIEDINKKKEIITNHIKKIGKININSIESLRAKVDKLNDERTNILSKLSDIREKAALDQASLIIVNDRITVAEAELAEYNKLMSSVEISGNSVEILDEFRENRRKTALPVVSNYATDLLNRFTDGRFIQLQLDEKFNPTVTLQNGVKRPVGLLSGGELSAVALSLRIAISILLNSGESHNPLVLDEVLVSQDNYRSALILNTIKEICNGQIIMISHGQHTNEIADVVVEL